jgi:hypothetical protein
MTGDHRVTVVITGRYPPTDENPTRTLRLGNLAVTTARGVGHASLAVPGDLR